MTPMDQRVGLGEMYAEGTQTYCVGDEKAGQVALDSTLRDAGWEPVSTSTTADATVWHYALRRSGWEWWPARAITQSLAPS